MVKFTQTICWLMPTNCLSVFDHFVELVLKELMCEISLEYQNRHRNKLIIELTSCFYFQLAAAECRV